MGWLKRPKVIAGVLINGAYVLFCLFTPTSGISVMQPKQSYYSRPLTFVSLPPPTGPSKATYFHIKERGELAVYLTDEIPLVNKPDHRLLLFPSFSSGGYGSEQPSTVLLSFTSYSREQIYTDDCPLVIKADDAVIKPIFTGTGVKHYVAPTSDGLVSETMGRDIAFDDFVQIIASKRVVVMLGPEVIVLSQDQIEPLRDMYRILQRYSTTGVPQPPPPPATYMLQPSHSPRLLSEPNP